MFTPPPKNTSPLWKGSLSKFDKKKNLISLWGRNFGTCVLCASHSSFRCVELENKPIFRQIFRYFRNKFGRYICTLRGGGVRCNGFACKYVRYNYSAYYEVRIVFGLQTVQILCTLLMGKYVAQIIFFPYILSLVFVLSRAKLKETNEETGLFSNLTQRKLE